MRHPPRQALLELWASVLAYGDEEAGAGHPEPDSVTDAERLVCLLYPAFRFPRLAFADPDATERDVLTALSRLGDHTEIPQAIVGRLESFLAAHSAPDGTPLFASGTQVRAAVDGGQPTARQQGLETVESYSISVTLALSALAFVKDHRSAVRAIEERLSALEQALSRRLTAAMRGLKASFTVDVFGAESPKGEALALTLGGSGRASRRMLDDLQAQLQPMRAGLRELDLSATVLRQVADESMHFQCGWSCGPVRVRADDGPERLAAREPSLYFTVLAMDGIVDFFSEQTRRRGLLGSEQQALAHDLRLRWELTQRYWTTLARFGDGDRPLADPPWRVAGEEPTDYTTLEVASIVVHNLMRHRGVDDLRPAEDLTDLANVLDDLAARARITRRASSADPAVTLHSPGVLMPLHGAEAAGPPIGRYARDFAPMLLKRMLQVAGLTPSMELRDRLMQSADRLFEHLWRRRLPDCPGRGLWDDPGRVYGHCGADDPAVVGAGRPSWYITGRVVEVLVVAASTVEAGPARSPSLAAHAKELLREAEHLLDQETMRRPADGSEVAGHLARVDAGLRRARAVTADRPGTAIALAVQALRELDDLAFAREQAQKNR
jgi:hypothetical protein